MSPRALFFIFCIFCFLGLAAYYLTPLRKYWLRLLIVGYKKDKKDYEEFDKYWKENHE